MADLDLSRPPGGIKNKFCNDRHARKLLKALDDGRRCPQLCDSVVVIGTEKLPVQKNVLSAASHYFRLLFSYENTTGTTPNVVAETNSVDLTSLNITMETFQTILDYIYTSEISLADDNIQDILQASDLLLLTDLKNLCCEYLESCISPHNCLGVLQFAAAYSCSWIHLKVSLYLDEHFREVSYSEEFLRLSSEALKELLSRDTVIVHTEEDILDSILRWFRFDEVSRRSVLQEVVSSCIRAGMLTDAYVDKIEAENLGRKLGDIVQLLRELRQNNDESRCRGTTQIIFVCGGDGNLKAETDHSEIKDYTRCVIPSSGRQRFDREPSCHWITLASMSSARAGHGLVVVGGCAYVVGGRDESCTLLNTGEKYDPTTNTWSPIHPMDHARVGFGLVAVDDNIYAVGGSNDMTEPLTSVEVYNIFTNKWRLLPEMNLKRSWSACTAVGNKIYVIAGGAIGKLFEAVECFDTKTETWYSVSPMRERRCDARAVTVDDEIYVFGGIRRIECPSAMHGGHAMKFCGTEIYSVKNDYWVQLQNRGGTAMCGMSESSTIYGAMYNGDEVFVVGELDMGGRFHCIRSYDKKTNTWQCVVPNHPPRHYNFTCCLLQMPTHVLRKMQWEQGKLTFADIKLDPCSNVSDLSSST